jgi:hypothetical protein
MNEAALKKLILIIGAVMATVIIIINIPYTRYVKYKNEEYIEVFELKEDIEKGMVSNFAKVMKECNYSVIKEGCTNHLIIPPSRCKFAIRNDDAVDGDFAVEIYLKFRNKKEETRNYKIYIKSGQTKAIKLKVPERLLGYRYYITPPNKEAEEYYDISKGNPIIMCKTSGHGDNVKEYCLVRKKRVFWDLHPEKYTVLKYFLSKFKD